MYPLFEVPVVGGPILIALIAVFHILPCHLATGAFWITYFIERKAYNENRPELLEFLKKYTLFILIFCFVTGSITGVGIWFASSVTAPRAISGLIHNYVWGWATEWVFFVIEIVTIYIYYYTFEKISPKAHMRIGLLYAMAAWTSMVIITGILAFMMTPGKWPVTGGFFDGFFNQTYWPQLFTRTALMFVIGGIFGLVVAPFVKNSSARETVTRTSAKWIIGGAVFTALFATWYFYRIPASARELIVSGYPYLKTMGFVAIGGLSLVTLFALVWAMPKPLSLNPVASVVMVIVLFAGIGGFESIREIVRRPYLIPHYMYSNQIIGHDMPAKGVKAESALIEKEGFLKYAKFVPQEVREINQQNYLAAGKVIAKYQCLSCHTFVPNGRLSLQKLLSNMGMESEEDIADLLDSLGDYPYMPPFFGTDVEKRATAAYLAKLASPDTKTDPNWVVKGE